MSHIFSSTTGQRRTNVSQSCRNIAPALRFIALLLSFLLLAGSAARAQSFVPSGEIAGGRLYHTSTLLPNGKVLVAGGFAASGSGGFPDVGMLYDPATGTFSPSGRMTMPRLGHTATLLNNGKVLLAGGGAGSGDPETAELYDPSTGIFTATGSMSFARTGYTATLLNDGRVLFAGGNDGAVPLAAAEVYDPGTGLFSDTAGEMTVERTGHTATLLPNGKVLIAGGNDEFGVLPGAELFDPVTNTFTATAADMVAPHAYHSATLLRNGKVLLAGGYDGASASVSAEIYDPAGDDFTATDDMEVAREAHTATLLGNGQVLLAGGGDFNGDPLPDAEVFDPAAGALGTFSVTDSMDDPRVQHTATLLNTGSVLIVGGYGGAFYPDITELYEPVPTTITSFAPPSGTAGTTVVITGTNFTGASSVKFNGGAPAVFTVDSPTQITTTVPTGAATGAIRVSASTLATSPTDFVVTGTTPPTVSTVNRASGSTNPTSGASVVFTVIFSESVTGVDASDFSLTATGSATGGISTITGTGTTRTVTVTGVSGVGTLRLDVLDDDSIIDSTSYPLLSGFTTGQSFTIEAATSGATISEFRTRGYYGSDDEYVELVNNTNAPLNISGWTLQFDSFGSPVTVAIPGAVTIPARAHFLFGGYGFCSCEAASDADLFDEFGDNDIDDDSGIALFNAVAGTMVDSIATTARPYEDGDYAYVRNPLAPTTFQFVAVDGGTYASSAGTLTAALGSPGPQNVASPIPVGDLLATALFDPAVAATVKPNQSRLAPTGPGDPNYPNGTLVLRRKLTNNSGAPMTKVRFRMTRLTTLGSHVEGNADIRAISWPDGNITTSAGILPVVGTTIDDPYTDESIGGGINCSTTDGTVTLGAPLAAGASRNYAFAFRVVTNGTFKTYISYEALP